MANPRDDDAVLGGNTPPPVGAAILGGLEGVKRRLHSPIKQEQIAALYEALKYGDRGMGLIEKTLDRFITSVEEEALLLLLDLGTPDAIALAKKINPYVFFECIKTLVSGESMILCLAIFPDGTKVASGGSDGVIKVWDIATGELVCRFLAHCFPIQYLEVASNNEIIVSTTNKEIKVWNVTTGEYLASGESQDQISSLKIAPNCDRVFVGSFGTIEEWDINCQPLRYLFVQRAGLKQVSKMAISPDGHNLIYALGKRIEVFNLPEFTKGIFDASEWLENDIRSVSLSVDGKILVASSSTALLKLDGIDGNLKENNLPKLSVFKCSSSQMEIVLTPDNKSIVTSSSNGLNVRASESGYNYGAFPGHRRYLQVLAIAPDGKIVTGGYDGTIKIWGLPTP